MKRSCIKCIFILDSAPFWYKTSISLTSFFDYYMCMLYEIHLFLVLGVQIDFKHIRGFVMIRYWERYDDKVIKAKFALDRFSGHNHM